MRDQIDGERLTDRHKSAANNNFLDAALPSPNVSDFCSDSAVVQLRQCGCDCRDPQQYGSFTLLEGGCRVRVTRNGYRS